MGVHISLLSREELGEVVHMETMLRVVTHVTMDIKVVIRRGRSGRYSMVSLVKIFSQYEPRYLLVYNTIMLAKYE